MLLVVAGAAFYAPAPVFACGGESGSDDSGSSGDSGGGSEPQGDPGQAPPGFGSSSGSLPWWMGTGSTSGDGSGEKGLRDLIDQVRAPETGRGPPVGRGSYSERLSPMGSFGADPAGAATTASGAEAPIGITEGAYALECSGCISFGAPDSVPAVASANQQKRVTVIRQWTVIRERVGSFDPALMEEVRAVVEAVLSALVGQLGGRVGVSVTGWGTGFLAVAVEVDRRTFTFQVSLADALQAYAAARGRGAAPAEAAIEAIHQALADAGIAATRQNMDRVAAGVGRAVLSRASDGSRGGAR